MFKSNLKNLVNSYKDFLIKGNTSDPAFRPLRSIFDKFMLPIYYREKRPVEGLMWPNGICVPGNRRLFISTVGGFFLCEKMGESIRIGDVESGFDFKSLNQIMNRYIEICRHGCQKCWAVRLCGACFVTAKVGSELHANARRKGYCIGHRRLTSEMLKAYCDISEKNPDSLSYYGTIGSR
jgi:uncharacterized protein